MEFLDVVTLDEGLTRLFALIPGRGGLKTERVGLESALHRVLASQITAPEDLPAFDRATKDGYAVTAADTFGASEETPVRLRIQGTVAMGEAAQVTVGPGQAARISTGGMLPKGADAVLMLEYTQEEPGDEPVNGLGNGPGNGLGDETGGLVTLFRSVAPGENLVLKGDDMVEGARVLQAGHRLRVQDVGALAALGLTEVEVTSTPVVAVISTGDEIVPPHQVPGPGEIRDINTYTLAAALKQVGAEPLLLGIFGDSYEHLAEATARALEQADVVLISGGSSVGTRDVTPDVINDLGSPGVIQHGLAVKPGKPTILGLVMGKPVFGLPGHPVSSMVVFDLVVAPTVRRLMGHVEDPMSRPVVKARMARNVAKAPGRREYIRVALEVSDDEGSDLPLAHPVLGESGLIRTMVGAHGLVAIALEKEGLEAGQRVDVILF